MFAFAPCASAPLSLYHSRCACGRERDRGKGRELSGYRLALLVDFVAAQRLPLSITGATDFIKHTLPLTHTHSLVTHTHTRIETYSKFCVCPFCVVCLFVTFYSFRTFPLSLLIPITPKVIRVL